MTTNDVPNIVVPEGESITVSMDPKKPGEETLYELVYTPDGSEQVVVAEKSKEPLSYTLDGPCAVQSLNGRSTMGLMILFR